MFNIFGSHREIIGSSISEPRRDGGGVSHRGETNVVIVMVTMNRRGRRKKRRDETQNKNELSVEYGSEEVFRRDPTVSLTS